MMPHFATPSRIGFLIIVALFCAASVQADNWPRFRGNNGTGVSNDKQVPVSWERPEEALIWKTEIPGTGRSCPIVWERKVFLQSSAADGTSRTVYCLDLDNGAILWKQSIPATKSPTHNLSSMASGTVATDGVRVYVPFWNGADIAIYAYDMKGKEVWKRNLGPFVSQHGAGHSPVIHEGKIFFANDQDDKSFVMAMRADNGEIVWKQPRESRAKSASYSTPFLIPGTERPWELVVLNSVGFTAYDPDTGVEVWKSAQGFKYRTVGSPVTLDGMIFAGTGNGGGARHAMALRLDRSKKPPVTTLVWEETKSMPYVPSLLIRGEHLYYANDRGVAGCCVVRTGEPVWTKRLGAGSDIYASPLLVDGRIYAVTKKGDVVVFAAEPKFQQLGQSTIGPDEEVIATPAVADGRLLIRGRQHLYCFGKRPKAN